MLAIGIDLGGTYIKAGLVHSKKGIITKLSIPTHAELGKDHILDRIAEIASQLKGAAKEKVAGIGLGIPGMVNLGQTTVSKPPNLPGWDVVNVSKEIEKRCGIPCRIENDANLAALGSAHFGEGRKHDSFVMITLGTGVGGGIIYNKKLYKGVNGMAGELGHVIINYHGPLSNGVTPGTIEAYLGQRFLSRFASDLIRQHPENELYGKFQKDFDKLEPLDLSMAANAGNELAIEILKKCGHRLGYAIINFVHILDIRVFILSGGVSKAGNWLLEPARETIIKFMMQPFRDGFELTTEDLGNDGAVLGAAGLAFDSF